MSSLSKWAFSCPYLRVFLGGCWGGAGVQYPTTNGVIFSRMNIDALLDYCSSSMQNQYFGLGSGRVKTHLGMAGKEPGV